MSDSSVVLLDDRHDPLEQVMRLIAPEEVISLPRGRKGVNKSTAARVLRLSERGIERLVKVGDLPQEYSRAAGRVKQCVYNITDLVKLWKEREEGRLSAAKSVEMLMTEDERQLQRIEEVFTRLFDRHAAKLAEVIKTLIDSERVQVVTISEARLAYGIAEDVLREMVDTGALRNWGAAGRRRISRAELETLIGLRSSAVHEAVAPHGALSAEERRLIAG